MNTPAKIYKYLLGLDGIGNAGLIGWLMSELANDPKLAALVNEFREFKDAESLSPSGVALDTRDLYAVRDSSVQKNGTPDGGKPQLTTP